MLIPLRAALGRRLAAFLNQNVAGSEPCTTNSAIALKRAIQPGDVLLVEGHTRVSAAIRYLTQSTWSHAALHVGAIPGLRETDGEPHVLVEAILGRGVVTAPLSAYATKHCRICRPVALSAADRAALVAFAVARIGTGYDVRNVVDLARYLLPMPPVPIRFRRRMIALGSGSPTQTICSTLIAQAFEAVRYPILPDIQELPAEEDESDRAEFAREVLSIRHHSLYTPRDFDISPYFQVVKPTIEAGFDYHAVTWRVDAPAA